LKLNNKDKIAEMLDKLEADCVSQKTESMESFYVQQNAADTPTGVD